MDKRFKQIQALINQLASGNFDYKISPSESQDELDAVILGINMLGGELKSYQDKNAALFEHVDDAILIFDINVNKFVDSNQTATKLLGFSKEDISELRNGLLDDSNLTNIFIKKSSRKWLFRISSKY